MFLKFIFIGMSITKHRECSNYRVHRLLVRVTDNSITTPNITIFLSNPNSNSKLSRNALPLSKERTVIKRGRREKHFIHFDPL